MNDSELLDKARKAYRNKKRAKSELERLSRYKGMTPAMKDDYRQNLEQLTKANADLDSVLSGKGG